MKALVVDDEPLARALLVRMLGEQGVDVIGEAGDAETGLALAEDLTPDVAFVDVRMGGASGLEATTLFGQLEPSPLVVLVTGFSEYAVEVYGRSAFDYMLKPVSEDRLATAIAKLRKQISMQKRAHRAGATRRITTPVTMQRLPVRNRGTIRLLPVDKILYASASGKSVTIRTKESTVQTTYTLTNLEQVLPSIFMRLHASCIVNLACIAEILLLGNHSYAVRLSNGDELPLARHQYPRLQERLGFPQTG